MSTTTGSPPGTVTRMVVAAPVGSIASHTVTSVPTNRNTVASVTAANEPYQPESTLLIQNHVGDNVACHSPSVSNGPAWNMVGSSSSDSKEMPRWLFTSRSCHSSPVAGRAEAANNSTSSIAVPLLSGR